MLNFGASKPRVGGGPGPPPWIRTWRIKHPVRFSLVVHDGLVQLYLHILVTCEFGMVLEFGQPYIYRTW